MRTTGQRLDEHHQAIQRLLDWWGEALPALARLEERVDALASEVGHLGGNPALVAEVTELRDLLAKVAATRPPSPG